MFAMLYFSQPKMGNGQQLADKPLLHSKPDFTQQLETPLGVAAMSRTFAFVLISLTTVGNVYGELKPNPLFSDHAVLQRGKPIPVWGTATPGAEITVTLFGKNATATTADAQGQWKVALPPHEAGGPFDMSISGDGDTKRFRNIMVGEVWVCSGQSNMEWSLNSSFNADWHVAAARIPRLRFFQVPNVANTKPQSTVNASWAECTPQTAAGFSAVGYFFGRNLLLNLDVPIGLIQSDWGGTPAEAWTSREALDREPILQHYHANFDKALQNHDPEKAKADYEAAVAKAKEAKKAAPRKPGDPRTSPNPSTLYNAMIHPLMPYAIRGAIWYQGESNGSKGFEYRTLFPTMIKDWRDRWGQGDFPFLCVQLAPYATGNKPDGPQWAELREAQHHATKVLPNVGMAVITDVGEAKDIHPRKKEPVGARLALLARKMAYGEQLVASGPEYNTMTIDGNKIVLSFDNVGSGLVARDGPLTDFTICGEDRQFVPAKAEIKAGTVIVSSDAVEKPIAVRYGWRNCPECNLFNKNGLPASPFRTDDFPLTTAPKQ